MQPSRAPRFAIGQLMKWIAVAAVVLAFPRLIRSPDRLVAGAVAGVFVAFILLDVLVGAAFGKRCPACSRRGTLRRLARHRHYYRCSACRAKLKRFGVGPWLDASEPEDAARYRGRTDAGTWTGYASPGELEGSSSGQLLRGKRSRDLLDEIHRCPPLPGSGRRLKEAEEKVRKFLKNLHGVEE